MRARRHQSLFTALLLGLCFFMLARPTEAAQHRGESRFFDQPDGTRVEVRLFGTEFYLRAESVDGYSLAFDHASGWICYAESGEDGGLRATSIHYRGIADAETLRRLAQRGVAPGLRASQASIRGTVAQVRQGLPQGRQAGAQPG